MDPELQRKIDEAKANGYTDEEIQQYLATKDQPVPEQQPMDRSEEYIGLAQGAGASTAGNAVEYGLKYGVPAAGAYYGVKKAAEMFKGPVAPNTQAMQATQATQSAVPQRQAVNAPSTRVPPNLSVQTGGASGPVAPNTAPTPTAPATPSPAQAQQQSMMQRGIQYADKIKQIAMEKVMQNAGTLSNVARAGAGVAAAVMPGNIGQD